jgi:hypothetical protein
LEDKEIPFRTRAFGFHKALEVPFKARDDAFAALRSPTGHTYLLTPKRRKRTGVASVNTQVVWLLLIVISLLLAAVAGGLLFETLRNIHEVETGS